MRYSGPHVGSYNKEVTGVGILAPHQPPSSFSNTSNFCKSNRNGSHKEAFPLPEERLTTKATRQEGPSRTEPPGPLILWHQRAWLSSTHKTPHYTQGSGGRGAFASFATAPEYGRGRSRSSWCPQGQSLAWPQPPMCLQRRERERHRAPPLVS